MNFVLAQVAGYQGSDSMVQMLMMLSTVFVILIIPGIVLWIVFASRAARRKKRQSVPKE